MDSILNLIKKKLGYSEDYDAFDTDIISHINTNLTRLYSRCGIGTRGFTITGPDETFDDFLPANQLDLKPLVSEYVYMRVKLVFDPESIVGSVLNAWTSGIEELEFELMTGANTLI